MLRRGMQYVLTWDALEHCWLASPVAVPLLAHQLGRGAVRVNVVDLNTHSFMDSGE
jgi:hypothetical protein